MTHPATSTNQFPFPSSQRLPSEIEEAADARTASLIRRLLSIGLGRLCLTNFAICLLSLGWMVFDPTLEATIHRLDYQLDLVKSGERLTSPLSFRSVLLFFDCVAVILLNASWFLGLIWGSQQRRALKSWLAFATIVCCWLAVLDNWPKIAWWGKQQRLSRYIPEFETAARELRQNWPTEDGYRSSTGPFMAYPVDEPSVLILLTLPKLSLVGSSFGVVERDESGGLRFQLTGKEQGAWVEWHPSGKKPNSFKGGLSDWHELDRFCPLDDGWYLVRYLSQVQPSTG